MALETNARIKKNKVIHNTNATEGVIEYKCIDQQFHALRPGNSQFTSVLYPDGINFRITLPVII